MTTNKTVLSAKNLSIGYEKKIVASQLNFNLEAGKLIALIGANGVGKSTLLRTISRISKPVAGEIFINEKVIGNFSKTELSQQLSIVLTEKLPPSNLSVFELVALGRHPYTNWLGQLSPEDIVKTNEALQLTQTFELSAKKYFEVSDGQLQRVMIARALAQDTPIIILDEPTTHLDLLHKVSLLKLLKNLASKEQKCILFSTHDLELALQLSDEIIVMTDDFFVKGNPENLMKNGILNTIFDDENVWFDAEKGKFVIRNL